MTHASLGLRAGTEGAGTEGAGTEGAEIREMLNKEI